MANNQSPVIPSVIPNPDPSVVTSEAIDRRVNTAIAVVVAQVEGMGRAIDARIDGMEKAVIVFQADLTRVPTQLDRAISALREVIETRIDGTDKEREALLKLVFLKISELEARVKQHWDENGEALAAALASAKETTTKIEISFTKSIDAQEALIAAQNVAIGDKIGDLKDRVTAIESRTAGIVGANVENRQANQDNSARMIGFVGLAVSLAVGVGTIVARMHFG
jgi:hypothetical protein